MIWMGMSSKGTSDIYVHKGIQALNQETYLKECIDKRLLPFIAKYHSNGNYLFCSDLAKAHYSNIVQERLTEKNIPFVSRVDNPPNVPQARPIETVWTVIERRIYENNWEAKNIDHLVKRIKQKAKELDQKMLQGMIEGVRKKLRAMCGEMDYIQFFKYGFFCSTCHALSNKKEFSFSSSKMVEL